MDCTAPIASLSNAVARAEGTLHRDENDSYLTGGAGRPSETVKSWDFEPGESGELIAAVRRLPGQSRRLSV